MSIANNNLDFDLHGLVGIRVQNASQSDAAAVRRQLGPIEGSLHREPDISIRFVDRLPPPRSLRLLGADEAGFTEDAFWILRSKYKSQARVMIPLDQIGKHCEILCETGVAAVPLLIAIINLTALHNGALPLHASAFSYNGTGVLATGWSKGGKTETLLTFVAKGGHYIADEWVYLHPDGQMSGIPEPIRVWDWHLQDLPQFRSRAPRSGLVQIQAIKSLQSLLRGIPDGKWPIGKAKSRLMPFLKRHTFVDVAPINLFGKERMQRIGELHKILFVVSHASSEISIERIDGAEIAQRMVHSLQYEQLGFQGFYRMFRFAFPERANSMIDRTEQLQKDLLHRALANREAYAVYHPYPVSLPDLFTHVAPFCDRPKTPLPRNLELAAANEASP